MKYDSELDRARKRLADNVQEYGTEWRDAEIERLKSINVELLEWINRRKNKIHPTDPIHGVLKRAEVDK